MVAAAALAAVVAGYGFCPQCSAPGAARERRPGGDDICTAGHKYPSATALAAPKPPPAPKTDWTREELLAICTRAAAVPMAKWCDRDSLSAIKQVGECWALLQAGAPFRVLAGESEQRPKTDHRTIWVEHFDLEGFQWFEEQEKKQTALAYLPTPARLDETAGRHWY